MNFTNIETLLVKNDWHHINKTKEYLAKEDIRLKFNLDGPVVITAKENLPENIQVFRHILNDTVFRVKAMESCNVQFLFENIVLQNITLYKFSGHKIEHEDVKDDVYFAKLDDQEHSKPISDKFALALVKFFNTPRAKEYVERANGSL